MRDRTTGTILLTLAAIACSAGGDPEPSRSLKALNSFAAGAETTGTGAIGTLDDCIDEAIARSGSPEAVTELICPAESCPGESPDWARITSLTRLTSLDLSGRCIDDVNPIASLRALKILRLNRNQITDIRPLAALRQLRELELADNSIQDTWSRTSREPFANWSSLEKLDLSGNGFRGLLPIEHVPTLTDLNLRNNDLYSLRSLEALTRLHSLDVGNTLVDDLTPLAQMQALESVALDGSFNFITSVEPLRALIGRGSLRRVSVGDNCVTDCEALKGSENDCEGNQRPMDVCSSMRAAWAVPLALASLHVSSIESHARKDHAVWTVEQMDQAFEQLTENIDWLHPEGGCQDRAGQATALLQAAGFPESTHVLAFGNLRPLTTNFETGFVSFDWHIAPAIRVQLPSGNTEFRVLDPALLADRPLALREWYERLVDSRATPLDFSCERYRSYSSGLSGACDDDGNLKVDAIGDLHGIICDDWTCDSKQII